MADFINELRQYKGVLSRQQIQTLKGQALAGDVDGAKKGLERLLRRMYGKDWKGNC